MALREAGWTNLSGGPLGVDLTIRTSGIRPQWASRINRYRGGLDGPGSVPARMTVVIPFQVSPPEDAANAAS